MGNEIHPYHSDEHGPEDAAIDAYESMVALRGRYELVTSEAAAMDLVYGEGTSQTAAALNDGIDIWTEISTLRTPIEAGTMLDVFSRGIETSRSLAATSAPAFILKGLVSYHEGMTCLDSAMADASADVIDAAHKAILANFGKLLGAAHISGDELAPRRLQRTLVHISTVKSKTDTESTQKAPSPIRTGRHLSIVR